MDGTRLAAPGIAIRLKILMHTIPPGMYHTG